MVAVPLAVRYRPERLHPGVAAVLGAQPDLGPHVLERRHRASAAEYLLPLFAGA